MILEMTAGESIVAVLLVVIAGACLAWLIDAMMRELRKKKR